MAPDLAAGEACRIGSAQRGSRADDGAGNAIPEAASAVFGEGLAKAAAYAEFLRGPGVERGVIGPRETPRLWDRHVLNSAVIGELLPTGASVVDIGSGAGLPGIPLAIARPDLEVALVDSMARRVAFLQEAIELLGLDNARVFRGRAEEPATVRALGAADAVTSRAVAPLLTVIQWSAPLLGIGGRLIAMKGSRAEEELSAARRPARRKGIVDLRVVHCGEESLAVPTTAVVGVKKPARGDR
jgi:16S rRNA (guanine527-N7)-methyltransferase